MDKTWAQRDMRCPYLKTKLIETLLNNALDKYSPYFEVIYLYIYTLIYIFIYDPTNIYVFMCKIHTNSKEACIIRERI